MGSKLGDSPVYQNRGMDWVVRDLKTLLVPVPRII